jgi:hypothetical protein
MMYPGPYKNTVRRVTSRLMEIVEKIFSVLAPKFNEGAEVIQPCIQFVKVMLDHIVDEEKEQEDKFSLASQQVRI